MKALIAASALVLVFTACTRGGAQQPPDSSGQPSVEQPPAQPLPSTDPATFSTRPPPGQSFDTALPRPAFTVKTHVVRDPVDESRVGELRWISLQVQVQGADPGELALELQGPNELMYERRTAQLSGTPWDTQTAEFQIPVAGTMIDRQALTGTWAANLFLAGQPVAADSFELLP